MLLNDFQNKRILITGAAGFLGANLIRHLLKYHPSIHAVVRSSTDLLRLHDIAKQINIHTVDLEDEIKLKDVIEACKPDIVFHLAVANGHAKTASERLHAVRSNIVATVNLLEALLVFPLTRIIYAGSSLEYGSYSMPLVETMMLTPTTIRGSTKAAATLLCQQYALAYQLPLTILRIFSVYGPYEPYRFIPKALLSALNGTEILLTEPGYCHDFVFVDDVADACIKAASSPNSIGHIINIGSGQKTTNEEVIALIEKITNTKIKVQMGQYPNSPADSKHWVADINKAKTLLNWTPKHSLEQGLAITINWIKQNKNYYV